MGVRTPLIARHSPAERSPRGTSVPRFRTFDNCPLPNECRRRASIPPLHLRCRLTLEVGCRVQQERTACPVNPFRERGTPPGRRFPPRSGGSQGRKDHPPLPNPGGLGQSAHDPTPGCRKTLCIPRGSSRTYSTIRSRRHAACPHDNSTHRHGPPSSEGCVGRSGVPSSCNKPLLFEDPRGVVSPVGGSSTLDELLCCTLSSRFTDVCSVTRCK